MEHRTLGRAGVKVSEVGFGAWGIGKSMWGKTDDAESLRALSRALELGIDFFDTAFVYGDGHSEQLIAKALKRVGSKAFVATKCPPKNYEWPARHSAKAQEAFPESWVISCTERSLKKLDTECLDLQQFHVWVDEWLEAEGWRNAVEKLKRQGKIRYFGVSINDHDPGSALRLVASGAADTVQVIYNIFEQAPSERLLPLCLKMNVGVIVRVPFDEGSLTGTLTPETRFDPGDFRRSYFGGGRLAEACTRVEKLKPCLGEWAPTLPCLALKFVLAHPAVSVVIPGMRKAEHVEENAKASDRRPLPSQVFENLSRHAWGRNFYA